MCVVLSSDGVLSSFRPLVTSSGAVVTSTDNVATSALDVVMWSVRPSVTSDSVVTSSTGVLTSSDDVETSVSTPGMVAAPVYVVFPPMSVVSAVRTSAVPPSFVRLPGVAVCVLSIHLYVMVVTVVSTVVCMSGAVRIRKYIRKTCPCNIYPLIPHFYIAKLGYAGVYLFFLFLLQNIDCGYSLEPPRRGGSNVYPQSMF